MARTHFVQQRGRGKKGPFKELRCSTCGQPIEVGKPYKWFKMKTTYGGIKKSYHPDCEIPASHRTTSRMGAIYDAQTQLGNDLAQAEDFDSIREVLEAFAQEVRQVAEEYGESADNMESGFGHETYQSQELRERSEALEGWADEIEQWDFSGDEPDQDDYMTTDTEAYDEAVKAWEDAEPSVDESEEDEDELANQQSEHDDWEADEPNESEYEIPDEEAFQAAVEEVLEEARQDAEGTADNCPI
jgi:hypothetical protein